MTEWPENHENSVGLHFHEGVEEIKENDKNTKTENLQNGQEKYGGKNFAYEIALNGYLDKFLT